MRDKNENQIIRFDGSGVFFEAMTDSFEIGKVLMNFCEYDKTTNKQIKKIDIYFNVEKFLALAHDVLHGNLDKLGQAENARVEAEKVKTGKTVYAQAIYTDMGGVTADKAAKFRSYPKHNPYFDKFADGIAISRQFKIMPGARQPWMLTAEVTEGETNKTGLIVPKSYKPVEIVRVPMTDETLKQFVLMVKAHYEAYLTAKYTGTFAGFVEPRPKNTQAAS